MSKWVINEAGSREEKELNEWLENKELNTYTVEDLINELKHFRKDSPIVLVDSEGACYNVAFIDKNDDANTKTGTVVFLVPDRKVDLLNGVVY